MITLPRRNADDDAPSGDITNDDHTSPDRRIRTSSDVLNDRRSRSEYARPLFNHDAPSHTSVRRQMGMSAQNAVMIHDRPHTPG